MSNLKIILGLTLLIAMVSQNHLDPSPLNLLRPADGVGNWFGMPGALVAGFFWDFMGICGLVLPLSLIFLKHKDGLSRRQVVLLDTSVLLVLTMGLAQLSATPDSTLIEMTGIIGSISNLYLQPFPGRLMTLLIAVGFLVRYARHYQFSSQSLILLQKVGMVLLLLIAYLDGLAKKRLGWLGERLSNTVSPFSVASREKLNAAKRHSAGKWRIVSSKILDWLIEMNPVNRLHEEKPGLSGIRNLDQTVVRELKQRELLRHTIAEFEKRSANERLHNQ